MRFPSPLRYPGGKYKISNFMKDIVIQNNLQGGTYIEPFAGGANVAFYLLFNSYVDRIIINDLDRSIYSFWFCVLNHTEQLCDMIQKTEVTIQEWERQKIVQSNKEKSKLVDLAFSTFFLNRTNRSGIINGGAIGGKKQDGKWKIDVRYNKNKLIERIKKISEHKDNISLYCADSIDFLNSISDVIDDKTLIYFDPPYYNKGSSLYVNHFNHQDHEKLAKFIQNMDCKWVLTYDYTPEILNMYNNTNKKILSLNYSVAKKVKGLEMFAFKSTVIIPTNQYSSIQIEEP
jgi:Site-specific DNA methylase